jgi:hypothetical protein
VEETKGERMKDRPTFVEWMAKIGNVYYADRARMDLAYEKILRIPCELNED